MTASPVSREALLHVVKNLPAAPRILAQLGRLLLDTDSDLSDVIDLLKHDSGLTVRVIRVSNSVVYGAGSRAASLEEALIRVGFNEVYRLVGLAAVSQIGDDSLANYGISGVRFRENSLFVAFVMEVLAPNLQLDVRTAYTAGLLRSTGKIAIDRLAPGPVATRCYPAAGRSRPIDAWEIELVGMNNCTAAGIVLEEWRFPLETAQSIRDHYQPTAKSSAMAVLMNLAAGLADRAGFPLPGEETYWAPATDRPSLPGIDEEEIERAVAIARGRFERVREAIS